MKKMRTLLGNNAHFL